MFSKTFKMLRPVPGDNIIGYITKGRGVSVHRIDCTNVKELIDDESRIIDVYWQDAEKVSYNVDIEIYANDRNGLLADIIKEVSNSTSSLIAVNSRANREKLL